MLLSIFSRGLHPAFVPHPDVVNDAAYGFGVCRQARYTRKSIELETLALWQICLKFLECVFGTAVPHPVAIQPHQAVPVRWVSSPATNIGVVIDIRLFPLT